VRREWLWVAIVALLLSSMALGWMAWEKGEVELYLFLIFPVLKADGVYGAAALLLAFATMVLVLFALFAWRSPDDTKPERGTSVGGVIMIGPIPIVLGSDRRTTIIALILALVVLMIIILLLVQ